MGLATTWSLKLPGRRVPPTDVGVEQSSMSAKAKFPAELGSLLRVLANAEIVRDQQGGRLDGGCPTRTSSLPSQVPASA